MNLNELRDKAYDIACRHGWHDKELSDEHYLMLIITELAEAVEADRKGKHAKVKDFKWFEKNGLREEHLSGEILESCLSVEFDIDIKDTVEDELADVVIRCLDFAGLRDIDLEDIEGDHDDFSEDTFTEAMFKITRIVADSCCDDLWLQIPEIIDNVFEFCNVKGIDIEWFINQKMRYNENRPYKHNKEY